jgi:hypothetical protein
MPRDTVHRCRGTSLTVGLWLVVPVRVEAEFTQELSVGVQDAEVKSADEYQRPRPRCRRPPRRDHHRATTDDQRGADAAGGCRLRQEQVGYGGGGPRAEERDQQAGG